LIAGRNAWHSTWVRHYSSAQGVMFKSRSSAEAAAEERRVQGTRFYIVDAPALLLRGLHLDLILADFHPDNPFARWRSAPVTLPSPDLSDHVLLPGTPMRRVLSAFGQGSTHWEGPTPSSHSLLVGEPSNGTYLSRLACDVPLFRHESRSHGSHRELDWSRWPTGYLTSGTERVISLFDELLGEIKGYAESLAILHEVDGSRRSRTLGRDLTGVTFPRSQKAMQVSRHLIDIASPARSNSRAETA
jgi:hypothetical protein